MVRAVYSSAPLSGAAPFLRTCRLGWGLVCHISAVSRGRSPGNCFPQLGPQLFVITGEAVTSRSRSSQILMGWWSAQRNDFRSPLVELANTTSSVKGSTKRGVVVQARITSQSIFGALTHFLKGDARCGSKLARWRCRDFFTKERMRHVISDKPALRDRTRVPLLCLGGPTEKNGCITPAQKAHAHETQEKNWQHFEHLQIAMARTGRYEEEARHKAGVGANHPVCSAELSGCASSWLLPAATRR